MNRVRFERKNPTLAKSAKVGTAFEALGKTSRANGVSSVLHGVGNCVGGEVTGGDQGRASSQDGAQGVVGVASKKMLQSFAAATIGLEGVEEARNGVRNFVGAAAVADGARDRRDVADSAADAEIVGVDEFAIDLDFLALDANVGDPVLAATVRAAGDVEFDLMFEPGIAVFESFGEPAGEALGFCESEFAEFGAGASNRTANEGGASNGESSGVELGDDGADLGFGDVDQEEILHGGGAELAVGMVFGELGGEAELRRGDAPTNDRGPDGEEAGLLLGSNTEMIAVEFRRKTFGYGGIESEPESLVDGGEKTIRRPAVLEEKKLHARAIPAFAKDIAGAKNFGDGTHDGDD